MKVLLFHSHWGILIRRKPQSTHRVAILLHFIMMEKSALAGDGGGCTPTPFHSVYHNIQSVRSSWDGRYTPPISSLPCTPGGVTSALIKNKIKLSSYRYCKRKFRREQLQSHIWLTASSYMTKYLHISSYIGKPLLIYDFATAPFRISFYVRKIFSFLFSQCVFST
jgi:hypothetical protein